MNKHHLVDAVTQLYSVLSPNVQCIAVKHEPFHQFHNALTILERHIKSEEIVDEYLLEPVRRLRYYRFEACAAPLDFNTQFLWRKQTLKDLFEQLDKCEELYPDFAVHFHNIFIQLSILHEAADNPLKAHVLKLISSASGKSVGLLLPEARFVVPVRNALYESHRFSRKFEIISPSVLADNVVYSNVIMVGTPRWYPNHVFNACRSANLQVVNFNWLHDDWKPSSIFGNISNIAGKPSGSPFSTRLELVPGWTRPADILPASSSQPELASLVNDLERSSAHQGESETLSLRLFILESGFGVFLEELNSAKIRVLSLVGDLSIDNINISDVLPGVFLLLRTRGGGDYITLIADRLMGDRAVPRRTRQELWKAGLRAEVATSGIEPVRSIIARQTGQTVTSGQLKYWMWSGSIGPQKPSDFVAVLTLLDMGEHQQQYQEDIKVLRHFHLLAGNEIAGQLKTLVQQANLQNLVSTGAAEFALTEYDGGSITAIRVLEKTNIILNLPTRRARQLFDVEDKKWQE